MCAITVFEARDITKVYHMGEVEVHALRGVDLHLLESEFIVLLGPSGSGSSHIWPKTRCISSPFWTNYCSF